MNFIDFRRDDYQSERERERERERDGDGRSSGKGFLLDLIFHRWVFGFATFPGMAGWISSRLKAAEQLLQQVMPAPYLLYNSSSVLLVLCFFLVYGGPGIGCVFGKKKS